MYLSEKTLAEIKNIQTRIIEGSITYYSVDFLQSISKEHDDLWARVCKEYVKQKHNEDIAEESQNQRIKFEAFTENIRKMIGILKSSENYKDKIDQIFEIVNKLCAVMSQDIKREEYSGEKSSLIAAYNVALNELIFSEKYPLQGIKFNGISTMFDSWHKEILSIFEQNLELNDLQKYSLVLSSSIGLGRRIFVYVSVSILKNTPITTILERMKEAIHNPARYYAHIWSLFQQITGSEIEVHKQFHGLLIDFLNTFPHPESSPFFKHHETTELLMVVITKIKKNVCLDSEKYPLTFQNVYNSLDCLVNLSETRRKIQNPDSIENVLPEAPLYLQINILEQLSSSLYKGFFFFIYSLIMFKQNIELSYIGRSLVVQDVDEVIIYLYYRGRFIASFLAFVTDDPMMACSLVIGSSSIEIVFNNLFRILNCPPINQLSSP